MGEWLLVPIVLLLFLWRAGVFGCTQPRRLIIKMFLEVARGVERIESLLDAS